MKMGSLEVWKSMAPWLAGIGPASVACTFLVNLYYNVIIAWALLYLGYSFSSPLPWAETSETTNNITTVTMDSHIFFTEEVLHLSDNMNEVGGIPWRMWLSFTVAWLLIFGIIYKGIESSGKVVYFTVRAPLL